MSNPVDVLPEAEFVDVPWAQAVIGVSRTTLYTMLNTGALRSCRLNGRRLIPRDELERFVDELKASAS